jgi:predicted  nucleic acid-binding Zn-ribbon protein
MAGTNIDTCKALLEVQRFDLILDELSSQEANLPHKAKVAQIAHKIAEGKSLVEKLEEGILKFDDQIKDAGKRITALNEKIEREQKRLDAGDIDYRQIEAVTTDIAAHHERVQAIEQEEFQLFEARDAAASRIADYTHKIGELNGAKEQTLNAYRQQMAILAAKTVQITTARDQKREGLDGDLLSRYDMLRTQRGGSVVGTFDGVRCLACSLALPTAMTEDFVSAGDIGTCSECRRILVYLGEPDG